MMRVTRSQTKLGNIPVTANTLPNDEQIEEGSIMKKTTKSLDKGEGSKSRGSVKNQTGKKLAKTVAERSKKHAMKMVEDPEKKVKFDEKNREKMRKYRSNKTEAEKKELKKKDRDRKKAKSLEKKATEELAQKTQVKKSYKTAAALGKALMKISKMLPKDPEKANEVKLYIPYNE